MLVLRLACALLVALPLLGGAANSFDAGATIVGAYCGELYSGGQISVAVTVLDRDETGAISGRYQFIDGDRLTEGTLTAGAIGDDRVLHLVWRDQYGSGPLVIRFAPDFSSFLGRWGNSGGVPNLVWNGRRCRELSS